MTRKRFIKLIMAEGVYSRNDALELAQDVSLCMSYADYYHLCSAEAEAERIADAARTADEERRASGADTEHADRVAWAARMNYIF